MYLAHASSNTQDHISKQKTGLESNGRRRAEVDRGEAAGSGWLPTTYEEIPRIREEFWAVRRKPYGGTCVGFRRSHFHGLSDSRGQQFVAQSIPLPPPEAVTLS